MFADQPQFIFVGDFVNFGVGVVLYAVRVCAYAGINIGDSLGDIKVASFVNGVRVICGFKVFDEISKQLVFLIEKRGDSQYFFQSSQLSFVHNMVLDRKYTKRKTKYQIILK